jgi:hypothetical protein
MKYRFGNADHTLVVRDGDGVTFPWNPVTGRPVSDLGHVYEQWCADGQLQPAPFEEPEPIAASRVVASEQDRRRLRESSDAPARRR